jgi:arylsulfatase A-like enzyme
MANIVLLVVDTWRKKDFVKDNSLAPFLSSKAKEGINLENYYANSPWTVPAHASMFSGKLPSEHGTTTENTYFSEQNELCQYLQTKGYQTVGLSENMLITEETGFSDGFDIFKQSIQDLGGETWKEIWEKDDQFENRKQKYLYFFKKAVPRLDVKSVYSFSRHATDKILGKEADYNAGKAVGTLNMALKHLETKKNSFVFANIMPVHASYTFDEEERKEFLNNYDEDEIKNASKSMSPEEFLPDGLTDEELEIREKSYKASIKYTDKIIRQFYKEAPEDTVFIVLGDHGELTGEYKLQDTRLIGHHLGTYKELIETPCIIFSKGKKLNLEIDPENLYSHTEIIDIIKQITEGQENNPQEMIRAEYFGRKGFAQQFNRKVPEGCEQIYNRKSFSIINSEIKYDLTTDGEYAWKTKALTEEKPVSIDAATKHKDKAQLLYNWRLEK